MSLKKFILIKAIINLVILVYPRFIQLVCEAVISSARELGLEKDEDGNELLDMALIHLGHSRIQSRLRCFAKLVQTQPNVLPRLRENFRENESEVVSTHKVDHDGCYQENNNRNCPS